MDKKIELSDAIVDDIAFYLGRAHLIPGRPGVTTYPPRADTMDARRIVSAVLNHPEAAGLLADEDPADARPWELLNGPLRVGDEVRQDWCGLTITGVVGRVDGGGNPWSVNDSFIGLLEVGTWYVRRAVQELPTEPGAVIVPADGHDYIEATMDNGETFRAREAIRSRAGAWYAAWRFGKRTGGVVLPEAITPGTWKVADQ